MGNLQFEIEVDITAKIAKDSKDSKDSKEFDLAMSLSVIPVKTGIQVLLVLWTPAAAGVTKTRGGEFRKLPV